MNFLEITALTAESLPAALELDRSCLGGLWTLDGYQRELESPNSDLLVLQHTHANAIDTAANQTGNGQDRDRQRESPPHALSNSPILGLGCLWAILEEAHITILAVHPDYQGQGLGKALLYALIEAAWRRQLEWVTLEVRVSNHRAIALYQTFGFQEVGHRRKYYQDTGEDALILWLSGLQNPEFEKNLRIWNQEVSDRLSRSGWQLINQGGMN